MRLYDADGDLVSSPGDEVASDVFPTTDVLPSDVTSDVFLSMEGVASDVTSHRSGMDSQYSSMSSERRHRSVGTDSNCSGQSETALRVSTSRLDSPHLENCPLFYSQKHSPDSCHYSSPFCHHSTATCHSFVDMCSPSSTIRSGKHDEFYTPAVVI